MLLHNILVEVLLLMRKDCKRWTPGETVPKSATYSAYSREGENGGSLYLERGKTFPATQHSGSYYIEAD